VIPDQPARLHCSIPDSQQLPVPSLDLQLPLAYTSSINTPHMIEKAFRQCWNPSRGIFGVR
jgi:hypothetical protein